MNLAFTDTETTHLSAEIGEVWEVAVILREKDCDDTEYVWQFRPTNPDAADPDSLAIGRYEGRFAVPPGHDAAFTGYPNGPIVPMTRFQAVSAVTNVLRGAVLVGSNPGFDDRFLRKLVGPGNHQWAHRPKCIANLAEGHLWALHHDLMAEQVHDPSSRWLAQQVGIEAPTVDAAHTALGDARWARDVYDAITGGPQTKGATA